MWQNKSLLIKMCQLILKESFRKYWTFRPTKSIYCIWLSKFILDQIESLFSENISRATCQWRVNKSLIPVRFGLILCNIYYLFCSQLYDCHQFLLEDWSNKGYPFVLYVQPMIRYFYKPIIKDEIFWPKKNDSSITQGLPKG